jgi:hypothetical protein
LALKIRKKAKIQASWNLLRPEKKVLKVGFESNDMHGMVKDNPK